MTDDFWNNRFHWCALAAGFLAASEGRLDDSEYVKQLAYGFFDEGAFRDRVVSARPQTESKRMDHFQDNRGQHHSRSLPMKHEEKVK